MSRYDYPELYKFVQGETTWTYTSADSSYGHDGDVYPPAAIQRGSFESSSDLARNNITIEIGLEESLAQHLLTFQADFVISITIFKQSPDDTVVVWRGRVASYSTTDNRVTITCESIYTSLGRAGLRARFQRNCRYALYLDYGCGLNKENFRQDMTFSAVNNNVVTVPNAATFGDHYFTGGMVRASNNSYGFIMSQVGSTITLSRNLEQLIVDAANSQYTISLYPGCNRTRTDCAGKFSNILNFGGFPWIPTKNPFGGISIA